MKMVIEMELRRSPRLAAKRKAKEIADIKEYENPTHPTSQSLDCNALFFTFTIVLMLAGCLTL